MRKNQLYETCFSYISMCDEMFVQTMIYNSLFYNTLYIKENEGFHSNLTESMVSANYLTNK